jgi:hypothetical protein
MFRWLTSFLLALALFSSAAPAGAPQSWAAGEPGGAALATDIERHSGGSDDGAPADGSGIALETGQNLLDGPGLVQTHDRSQFAAALAYPVPPATPARLLSTYLDGPQRPPRTGA